MVMAETEKNKFILDRLQAPLFADLPERFLKSEASIIFSLDKNRFICKINLNL